VILISTKRVYFELAITVITTVYYKKTTAAGKHLTCFLEKAGTEVIAHPVLSRNVIAQNMVSFICRCSDRCISNMPAVDI